MSKKYQNIKQYENMILELKSQGSTHREIGEKLGLRYIQVKKCVERYNKRQRMIKAGKELHRRGHPSTKEGELPPSIQRLTNLTQIYIIL